MKLYTFILFLHCLIVISGCRKKGKQNYFDPRADRPIPMEFEPFRHASTLSPGTSTFADAKKVLRQPIVTDYFKNKKGDTVKTWVDFTCGISIITAGNAQDTSKIDALVLQKPYKGKSTTGLKLNMPMAGAIKILNRNYQQAYKDEGTIIYRKNKAGPCLQVFFENDTLVIIKMYKVSTND